MIINIESLSGGADNGTKITDSNGDSIAGAYKVNLTIEVNQPNRAVVYCHSAKVDVQADAIIKNVCPHCGQDCPKGKGCPRCGSEAVKTINSILHPGKSLCDRCGEWYLPEPRP